ncbi:hypothetical protein ACFL35_16560, partial [Candidatus Riflebacteria bacterium]
MQKLMPNASYSMTIKVKIPHLSGMLAKVMRAIASKGGVLEDLNLFEQNRKYSIRSLVVDSASKEQSKNIEKALKKIKEVEVLETVHLSKPAGGDEQTIAII